MPDVVEHDASPWGEDDTPPASEPRRAWGKGRGGAPVERDDRATPQVPSAGGSDPLWDPSPAGEDVATQPAPHVAPDADLAAFHGGARNPFLDDLSDPSPTQPPVQPPTGHAAQTSEVEGDAPGSSFIAAPDVAAAHDTGPGQRFDEAGPVTPAAPPARQRSLWDDDASTDSHPTSGEDGSVGTHPAPEADTAGLTQAAGSRDELDDLADMFGEAPPGAGSREIRWSSVPADPTEGDPSELPAPFRDIPTTSPASAAASAPVTPQADPGPVAPDVTPQPPTHSPAGEPVGAPEPGWDLPDLFGSADLPANAAPQSPEAAVETTPAPANPDSPDSAEHPAPATYESTSDAMSAWRAMRAQRRNDASGSPDHEVAVRSEVDAELAHRYASLERLSTVVDRVLSASQQSGNPQVQATINGLVLTRDHALDAQQRAAYEAVMGPILNHQRIVIDNPQDAKTVLDMAYDEIIGVGPLGPLWRDDSVTEILVSGPNKVVCERDGKLLLTPCRFRDLDHLRQVTRDLASRVDDRNVSKSNPLVTAQLPGARVQFAMAPVAPVAGVSMTIRKFRPLFGLDELLAFNALDEEMAAFLSDLVAARATVLVSGGTGTGKTTMINALSAFIPDTERVITIEDALELSLTNTHVEQLLTKEQASGDDKIRIGQDDLLRASLRMRPDRIIVGEIRDGAGCATMLQAANTGHDGTMTTVHANNPDRALRRLSTLYRTTSDSMGDDLAAEEVQMAFDVVVQVSRAHGRRFISSIAMVNKDSRGTTAIFAGSYTRGDAVPTFRRVGSLSSDTEMVHRLLDAGIDPDPWS